MAGDRQPPLAEPALRGGVEVGDFHSSLPISVLLFFYNIYLDLKGRKILSPNPTLQSFTLFFWN